MKQSRKIPLLYHGTLKRHLKKIEKYGGLKITRGWGGQGTMGVFLSGTFESALLWAKIAYMVQTHQEFSPSKFDRLYPEDKAWDKIAILGVKIPQKFGSLLRADEEQREDSGFSGDEYDWRGSLKKIGDVRFDAPIPVAWLTKITPN